MQPTSSGKHFSLLQQGYSLHQIQSKTGLGKSTIGRIRKEVDRDKENGKGGYLTKLSSDDKWSIIHQINSRRLDNTVEATHFINSIIPNPIMPQTVRNILKQDDFCAVVKKNILLLRRPTDWSVSNFPDIIKTGQWKIGRTSYGQMRPKSTGLGQMG